MSPYSGSYTFYAFLLTRSRTKMLNLLRPSESPVQQIDQIKANTNTYSTAF